MTEFPELGEERRRDWEQPKARGPVEALRVGLRNMTQFKGRASRSEYWWFFAGQALVALLFVLTDFVFFVAFGTYPGLLFEALLIIVYFVYQLALLAVSVRRLHDMNFVGWWVLVPVFYPLALMKAGTDGPNRFG